MLLSMGFRPGPPYSNSARIIVASSRHLMDIGQLAFDDGKYFIICCLVCEKERTYCTGSSGISLAGFARRMEHFEIVQKVARH